jgi:hypothetical protein
MLSFIASGDTERVKLVIADFSKKKQSSTGREEIYVKSGLDDRRLKRHWGELSLTKQRKLSLKLRSTSTTISKHVNCIF